MIHFLLLQNRQGKTRMAKYYSSFSHDEKKQLESEVSRIVTTRDRKFSNVIEFRTYKLIYKRYASLFFTFCLDMNDNELLYLESIHLFVELLDKYFESVCEVQETSKRIILDRLTELQKINN